MASPCCIRIFWAACELLKRLSVRLTLLTNGLLLADYAGEVAKGCDEVIVSLDGGPEVHDAIRGVPGAYARLAAGVAALKKRPRHSHYGPMCGAAPQLCRVAPGYRDRASTRAGRGLLSGGRLDLPAFNRQQGEAREAWPAWALTATKWRNSG